MKSLSLALIVLALVVTVGTTGCHKKGGKSSSGLNRVHFDFDRATVKPEAAKVLDANAQYLKKNGSVKINVEGHCDERGTNEYNMALGDRRAKAAADYLVNKGVDASRVKTVSYGEDRPLEKGNNESAWYMNRRAEFVRQ